MNIINLDDHDSYMEYVHTVLDDYNTMYDIFISLGYDSIEYNDHEGRWQMDDKDYTMFILKYG